MGHYRVNTQIRVLSLPFGMGAVYLKLNSKKAYHLPINKKEDFKNENIKEVHHVEIKQ